MVPGLVAFIFGFFAFRSRIMGVYFSIITQALTFAAMLLFFRNETGFGGNNGFTDFKRILGYGITTPEMRVILFGLSALALMATLLLGRYLIASKFGRILTAIRDAESRVMFLGYNPLHYKLAIWTLSAMLCAIAGALYVPQVGIINPGEMSAANSIEIAIWAAVGGRGTLIGPVIAHAGIGRKFQKPTIFENHTVFENLELAMKTDKRVRRSLFSVVDSETRDRIAETLYTIHLADQADRLAGLLSHGQKQWLEIGMLLMQDPKLLLLDEPVAGMTDDETARTAELFLSLEGKHSLVVVEHDMSFVDQLTEGRRMVTVLHEGSVLAEGDLATVQADERVIEVYLGR